MKKISTIVLVIALLIFFSSPDAAFAATKSYNLSTTKVIILKEGIKAKLTLPSSYKNITWKSSNKKIVTVTKNGTISAINGGKATISAASGKNTFKCVISVKENYANWIPYSTSSIKTLTQNIKKGHVVLIDGQYYCSPEYAKELEKAREKAESEMANSYDTTTLSPGSKYVFVEEEDEEDSNKALNDRLKDILKNNSSESKGSSKTKELSEEEIFAKEWINEDELLEKYGIDIDGSMGDTQIKFIKDKVELYVIEGAGIYSDKRICTYEGLRYQYIFPYFNSDPRNQFYFNRADLIAKGIITE